MEGGATGFIKYGDVFTLQLGASGTDARATTAGLVGADGLLDAHLKVVVGSALAAGTLEDCLFVVRPGQSYTAQRDLQKFEASGAWAWGPGARRGRAWWCETHTRKRQRRTATMARSTPPSQSGCSPRRAARRSRTRRS